MKVTEQQLMVMFRVLEGSMKLSADLDKSEVFGFDKEIRTMIYEEIVNQQSEELVGFESKVITSESIQPQTQAVNPLLTETPPITPPPPKPTPPPPIRRLHEGEDPKKVPAGKTNNKPR